MSVNPYSAPEAPVFEAEDGSASGFLDEPIACPTGRGFRWVVEGLDLLRRAPATWLGMTTLWLLLALLPLLIPILGGVLSNVLNWILVAGMMHACDRQRRGESIAVGDLFEGFRTQTKPLAIIGLLYYGGVMLAAFVAAIVVIAIGGLGLLSHAGSLSDLAQDLLLDPRPALLLLALFVLVVAALVLPVIMAMWFAPALVLLEGMDPIAACRLSFRSCMRNMLPYLAWGIVVFVIMMLLALPGVALAVALGVRGSYDAAIVSVGLTVIWQFFVIILTMPLTMTSTYVSFRDIHDRT